MKMLKLDKLRSLVCGSAIAAMSVAATPVAADSIVASHYGFLLNTAPIAVAIELGEFEKRGVTVDEVISSSGGGTTMRNQIASGSCYGVVGTAAALAAYREGHDIKIISANVMTLEDLFWVSMPDSGIESIEDLRGKKVAYTKPRSTSETVLKAAIATAGIPEGEIEVVSLGKIGAGLAALERGDVAAALLLEPLWSGRLGKYKVAFDLSSLPRMTQTVGVTTEECTRDHADKLQAILEARRVAVDYLYDSPEEAAKLVAKAYGEKLTEEVAINAVKNMVAINYWGRGGFDIPGLDAMLDSLRDQGAWEGPIDWTDVLDKSFLPADLQS